jgi:hypothetical protein
MPAEGFDVAERVRLHHPTLTKPGSIGKDIDAASSRVLGEDGRRWSETASLSNRGALSPALTVAFGQCTQIQSPQQRPDLGD